MPRKEEPWERYYKAGATPEEYRLVQHERLRKGISEAPTVVRRPVEKVIPSGNWRSPTVTNGTVCTERDIEVVRWDESQGEYTHVKFDSEQQCVSFPNTKRCITQNKGEETDRCKLVELAFACADETSGMLTPLQASALTGVSHDSAKTCIRDLTEKGKIEEPPLPFEGHALPVQITRRVYDTALKEPVREVETEVEMGGVRFSWLGEDYSVMPPEKRQTILPSA